MYKDSARLGLLQIQPVRRSGWRQRRLRQVLHSIPHYFSELRELDSLREGLDWLYFKKPYLFKLRNFPVRVTVEFTNVSRPKKFVVGMFNHIVFSVDGLDSASFERQRKGGNYAEIREAAAAFRNYRCTNPSSKSAMSFCPTNPASISARSARTGCRSPIP